MLKSLEIENVALIDKLCIDFGKKLNVLSGETGAGKSIVIDALNFVIGGKTSKNLVRQDCDFMKVVAIFSKPFSKEIKEILTQNDCFDEEELILSRKMFKDGRIDTKVNGVNITASTLKTISNFLVDIHGQHEHQHLLEDKYHLGVVDNFIKDSKIKESFHDNLNQLKVINKQIENLNGSTENQERILDLLNYQIKEILDSKLKRNEDDELLQKKIKMQNFERIYESLNSAVENLEGNSITETLKKSVNNLNNIVKFDESFVSVIDRLNSCKFEIMDIIENLKDKINDCNFDKDEFEKIDERLDKINILKKKYGPSLDDVFDFLTKSQHDYDTIVNSKEKLIALQKEKQFILKNVFESAKELSLLRRDISLSFEKQVKEQLNDLGMKNAKFIIEFNEMPTLENCEKKLNENGFDEIKFMFSANLGQKLKPLSEIISGGEASRFMLGLKNILADNDNISAMVFDEIDTGISGEMGYMVACKMANISNNHQVMAVSHLPQICAMADLNLKVVKNVINGDTKVQIENLCGNNLLNEIARLSGGIENNKISLEHAKELKNRCNEYKKAL